MPHNEVVPYDEQWPRHLRRLRKRRICWLGLLLGGRLCVFLCVCVEYVMRVRYVTIIVQEKGYKNLQARKYHVFDIE